MAQDSQDEEESLPATPGSILEGVDEILVQSLSISALRHLSALRQLAPFDGDTVVNLVHAQIAENYRRGGGPNNKNRSNENWRWPSQHVRTADHNTSHEVVIERAVAAASVRLGRTDWGNQVPVSSGLIEKARDSRRAIDLVRRKGAKHFELIELKIASDTPLYAAFEILGYGCLWLIAKQDRPARESALLDADCIDLRVLAPSAYYASHDLRVLAKTLDNGVCALASRFGVAMSFAFQSLDDRIRFGAIPDDETLMALLDRPASVT